MMQTTRDEHQASAQKVIDPVCGMPIDPARAAGSSSYGGAQYFFCSRGCKQKFDDDPAKYLQAQPFVAAPRSR